MELIFHFIFKVYNQDFHTQLLVGKEIRLYVFNKRGEHYWLQLCGKDSLMLRDQTIQNKTKCL